MKPRAFVGSSVEGLQVAYAVQQNLLHDAEVTVWDQGVFELSSTTIESLAKALDQTDFGIFILSPDDVVRMRNTEVQSVRDNVLFELGLFIGKLGRERVFFLIPSDTPPNIPSDLLGVTPGKYDSGRSDGSMQAATGPACHQIRLQMKKLGALTPLQNLSGASGKDSVSDRSWMVDFFDEKYKEAKATLEASLFGKTGDDVLMDQAWIHYCDFKLDEESGLRKLLDFARINAKSPIAQKQVAFILQLENEATRAIKLLQSVEEEIIGHPVIKIALAQCFDSICETDTAISVLSDAALCADPLVALELSGLLEKVERKVEAIEVVREAYILNPRHEGLKFKYACLAEELKQHSVAVCLFSGLCADKPDSIEYWGYFGNACLSVNLYDHALSSYRKSEALIKSDNPEGWIIGNIGNLFNNKGLPTEAILYLERALSADPQSEYAHERMADALKRRSVMELEFKKIKAQGLKIIREASEVVGS